MKRLMATLLAAFMLMPVAGAALSDGTPDKAARLLEQLKRTDDPLRAQALREKLHKAWIAAGPVSAQVLLKEAAQAQAAGLRDTALKLLRLVTRRWPDYAEGHYRLAFFLWQTGDTRAALEALDRLLKAQPDHFPALSLKVRLLLESRQEKKALAACRALTQRFANWREMRRRCERLRWRLEQDV